MTDLITIDRAVVQQALEALEKTMHVWGGTCAWHRDVKLSIAALRAALAQADTVQDQDVEDAIEAAYWQFDCRKKGLNEWASAPQSERDAFKAEARKLVRGYFPTRQAQDTKREMLAVADAFIRGKRAALAQAEPVQPAAGVDAYDMIDRFLRNNLRDDDYAEYSAALDSLYTAPQQQAEPDHETRAELAEQQVVQLAEERDHYRRLWQKAQQAEPVQRKPLTEKEMYIVEEEARKNFRLSQAGPRGQMITYWDSLTPWLIRAVERAHGIKEAK